MGASMRPEDPADVWDRLVAQGKTPDEATAEVTRQFGPPPEPVTREQLESAGFILDRPTPKLGRNVPGIATESTRSRLGSRPTPGYGKGALRSAAAGPSMGASPYIIGAARGALSDDLSISEGIEREEQGLDRFRTEHPGTALGIEVLGAMAVPVPWTRLAALRSGVRGAQAARATSAGARLGATAANKAGNVAARSAVEGGVQGAFETRGGIGSRTAGAAIGAVGGATGATVLGAAGRAGGRLLGAAPKLSRAAAMGGLPILTPEERSADMLITAFADDALTLEEAGRRAGMQGPTPPPLIAARERVREATAQGKPFSVLDAGGRNVMGVGRGAQTRGGQAKEAIPAMLGARAEDAEQRVVSDLLATTGGARQDAFATADAIIARRESEAAPLFNALRQQFPKERPIKIDALDDLVDRPSMRSAIDEAERILQEEGVYTQPFRLQTKDGRTVLRPLSFDEAQLLKQAHDDVADMAGARTPIESGGTGRTRQAKQKSTHAMLIDALDATFPGYREARDAFAGPSAILKAHNLGAEFHKLTPEKVQRLTQDMSASERSAFRASALESFIANKVETIGTGHNVANRLEGSTRKKALMRQLFDSDEHFDAFRDLLAQEARMHQTRTFFGHQSQTADKLMELAEVFDVPGMTTITGALAGQPGPLAQLGGWASNKLGAAYSKNVANDIGRIATLTGDEAVQAFETLSAQAAEIARKKAAGAQGRQRAGRVFGGRLGGAVAGQGEP